MEPVDWTLGGFLALLVLSGMFSAAETAYTSLSSLQVMRMAQGRNPASRLAARLHQRLDLLITTILIGNNLVNIAATVLSTLLVLRVLDASFLTMATAALTLVIILFGEVLPKQVAITNNEALAALTAVPLALLVRALYPISWTVSRLAVLAIRLSGGKRKADVTLEGILMMVRAAEQRGLVGTGQDRIVRNVFRTQSAPVKSVMTHRTQVFALSQGLKVQEAVPLAMKEGFSRIPVYRDNLEIITGVVLLKDLVRHYLAGQLEVPLHRLMKEPIFIPESRKIGQALFDMLNKNYSLAVVLDEYGGLAGIVTREDLLEEVFGEMYDEDEAIPEQLIQPLGSGEVRILGSTPLHLVEEYFQTSLKGERVHTFGGYLIQAAGRVPVEGEWVDTPLGKVQVQAMSRHRVLSAVLIPHERVTKLAP